MYYVVTVRFCLYMGKLTNIQMVKTQKGPVLKPGPSSNASTTLSSNPSFTDLLRKYDLARVAATFR